MLDQWNMHVQQEFNIFRMVSEIYYRENFHSDILKVLLEAIQTHLVFSSNL